MGRQFFDEPLYRTLVADPGDRGVLADWLDERGEAERAAGLRAAVVPKELDDYDWGEAFEYAREPSATPPDNPTPAGGFRREDVRQILHRRDGENDTEDWVVVGELWDGRFFVLRAHCDYTGWS
jgi:uncharacterized protein (TIGR02996 family)